MELSQQLDIKLSQYYAECNKEVIRYDKIQYLYNNIIFYFNTTEGLKILESLNSQDINTFINSIINDKNILHHEIINVKKNPAEAEKIMSELVFNYFDQLIDIILHERLCKLYMLIKECISEHNKNHYDDEYFIFLIDYYKNIIFNIYQTTFFEAIYGNLHEGTYKILRDETYFKTQVFNNKLVNNCLLNIWFIINSFEKIHNRVLYNEKFIDFFEKVFQNFIYSIGRSTSNMNVFTLQIQTLLNKFTVENYVILDCNNSLNKIENEYSCGRAFSRIYKHNNSQFLLFNTLYPTDIIDQLMVNKYTPQKELDKFNIYINFNDAQYSEDVKLLEDKSTIRRNKMLQKYIDEIKDYFKDTHILNAFYDNLNAKELSVKIVIGNGLTEKSFVFILTEFFPLGSKIVYSINNGEEIETEWAPSRGLLDIIKSHYIGKYSSAAQSRMENKYLKYKHKYLLLKNETLFN